MTTSQIYEAMTGKPTRNKNIVEKIDNSVMNLMQSLIHVNYTNQAKARGLDCKKAIIKENILHCKGITITFPNGEVSTGWQLLAPPALYEYAQTTKQIITVEEKLLSAPKITNTDDVIVIKHYLLRRIAAMKNTHNNMDSNKIVFDTILQECDINETSTSRRFLQKKRNIVLNLLDAWKKDGYISDFSTYNSNNNKIIGVEIFLGKPKKNKI